MLAPDVAQSSDASGPERSMDLLDFVEALRKRWKTIALSTAVTTGLGLAYLAFTPTAYTATVSILVDARPRAPVGSDPAANANATADTVLVESQVKLFTSDTVLRRVVQREGLADDPDFAPTRVGLRTRLMGLFGLGSGANAEDRATKAVLTLARAVVVKRSERTYVIDVDVSAGDPAKAARLANSVADAYLADQVDARASLVRRDAKWLNQRIGELQARVQEAENRAQTYRAEHGITDANGKSVGDQELADYATELGKARARTIDAKTRWERFQQLASSGKINDIPIEATKSAVLDKLRGQYADLTRQEANLRTTLGDRHPAMVEVQNQLRDTRRSIADELKRLSDVAGAEYQVARAAEAENAKRVEDARRATNSRNQTSVELRELERDVDASRSVYEKFLRARETMDEDSGDGPAARVIAPALAPVAPSSPKTMAILFASIASGLFAGVGIALFNDYMSHAGPMVRRRDGLIHDVDDEEGARTPVIVTAPRIGADRRKIASWRDWMMRTRAEEAGAAQTVAPLSEVEARPDSDFSKSIGELYGALAGPERGLRRSRRRTRVVMVASMAEGAGKTTIAANLARHAASMNRRTLLIDANPDNPSLSAVIAARAPGGLIELQGKSRPVYKVAEFFWVVPIMAAEERIAARLARRPNVERIDQIAGEFDFVVIDGPTIEFDGEARHLAGAVDRIVIVTAAGQPLPLMEDVADLLEVPESKVAGAVVSAPKLDKAA